MTFYNTLLETGFSSDQAEALAEDEYFKLRNANKKPKEIKDKIIAISKIYKWKEEDTCKAVSVFSRFLDYDHQRYPFHYSLVV